ncbi:MAG: LysM peptidoglycan-binding domain-containing protein [Saprospiraceae bacterium]|nr:LysM peptidoglycan-binding domain-containing protein [Lewinellaceae bacterium]
MTVKEKYQSVLSLGEKMNVQGGKVEEENGVLKVFGTVDCQYEKNQIWDAIKAIGGEKPTDIKADIRVANTDYYAKHTVSKGESLSKIAEHYYEDMMKYKVIFNANRDILDNPDVIHPGQVLTIPNI